MKDYSIISPTAYSVVRSRALSDIFLAKEIISKEDSINLTSKLEKNINLSEELIEILFSNFEVKVGKSIMDEYAYNNFKQDN